MVVLDDLAVQKLIVAEQKKCLFGKEAQARITDIGSRLLSFKKQELEAKSRDLESMYMNRDRRGVESFMDDNRAWIPMMIFSGILSSIMFASMMSFMGLAMNPAEAAGSYGRRETANADAQGAADTQSADNDNGIASSAGADISTEESSGFDTIGGDFGGDFEF